MTDRAHNWFIEKVQPGLARMIGVDSYIFNKSTRYQKVEVMKSPIWGKCLILDGNTQSAQFDEYIYHEVLVHPAMLFHPEPKNIMIAGGGEGAILREILKHPSVEKVVMVDLDSEVVGICQEYLPEWSNGSFGDPRVTVIHEDARHFLETTKDKYDIIFMDLPEPLAGGPCYLLYTEEFYQTVADKLTQDGAIALQADYLTAQTIKYHGAIAQTIKQVFSRVESYGTFIPSYGTNWGFIYATNAKDSQKASDVGSKMIDQLLTDRNISDLLFYDGITHQHLFNLPKNIRSLLNKEHPIIKDDLPLCK